MSSWTNFGCYFFLVFYLSAAQECPCFNAEMINTLLEDGKGTRLSVSSVQMILDQDWYATGVLLRVPGGILNKIDVECGNLIEKQFQLAQYLIQNYEHTQDVLAREERNPLSEPTLQQAFLVTHDVENIYSLGLLLGINKEKLDSVFKKDIPSSQIKAEILYIWLKNASEALTYRVLENAVKILPKAERDITVITKMFLRMVSDKFGLEESDYAAAEISVRPYGMIDWYLLGVYLNVPKHILDDIERSFSCKRYDSDRCLIETVYYWVKQNIKQGKKCDYNHLRKCCAIASNPDTDIIGSTEHTLTKLETRELTLRNVLEIVIEIRDQWYEFGILIGIDKYKLDTIEKDYQPPRYQSPPYMRCIIDVLDEWMNINWQSYWKIILRAKNRIIQQTPASPDEMSVPYGGSLNLMNTVYAASGIKDWYLFGKQLGLSDKQLKVLQLSDHRQDIRRMVIEVIDLWSRSGTHLSREVFNSAVSNSQSDSCPSMPDPYTSMQSTSSVATTEPVSSLSLTHALRYVRASGADNWYMLGVKLGLSKQFLDNLFEDTRSITEKTEIILEKWFEGGHCFSWPELHDAVDSSKVTVYSKTLAAAIKQLQKRCSDKADDLNSLILKLENRDHKLEIDIKYLQTLLKNMQKEVSLMEVNIIYQTTLWSVQKSEEITSRLNDFDAELDEYSAEVTKLKKRTNQKITAIQCEKIYRRLQKELTRLNENVAEIRAEINALNLKDAELLKKMLDITADIQEIEHKMISIKKGLEFVDENLHLLNTLYYDHTEKIMDAIHNIKIHLKRTEDPQT